MVGVILPLNVEEYLAVKSLRFVVNGVAIHTEQAAIFVYPVSE